jgi:DNA-binding transcriptional regulator PaaX
MDNTKSTIIILSKTVVTDETPLSEIVPDELLDLFDEFGIGEDAVRKVLGEDNGILDALAARKNEGL